MRFGIKKQVSAAQNVAITLINIFIGEERRGVEKE
jgi:hypothetical protein